MLSIILKEPENPGNLGAIARVMGNFGIQRLYLIDPRCDHLSEEAICRAKHAQDILSEAIITKEPPCDLIVGTTAKKGSDKNINRVSLEPAELARKAATHKGELGILLGRESTGLTNKELEQCDFTVSIPTCTNYPTLNISHACSILCYELTKEKNQHRFELPDKSEKDTLLRSFDSLLEDLDFMTEERRTTQKRFWKRFLTKNFMTKQELYIILGFLKQIRRK